jgi:hypothetical protein
MEVGSPPANVSITTKSGMAFRAACLDTALAIRNGYGNVELNFLQGCMPGAFIQNFGAIPLFFGRFRH